MQTPSPYEAPSSAVTGEALPSFAARLLGLGFRPDYWRDSPEYPWSALLLPLFVLLLVASTAAGVAYAGRARSSIHSAADVYAANGDPLVYEDGHFRLAGPRVFRMTADDLTILIDPDETVPDSALDTPRAMIVRADRIIVREPSQTRVIEAAQFATAMAKERFVIDRDFLRELGDDYVYPTVIALCALLLPPAGFVASLIYALAAGGLLLLLRGQWLGLRYVDCVKVAVAACAATVWIDAALVLLDVKIPFEFLLWPLLLVALGLLGLASRTPRESRSAWS